MHQHGKVNKDIRDKVPDERVFRRLNVIKKEFLRLQEIITTKAPNLVLELNERVLSIALKSYFYDLERLKHFHDFDLTNEPKKAGYLLKWLVKNKPIYFDLHKGRVTPELSSFLLCINEIFALRIAFAYAGLPIEKIENDCWKNLVYHTLYREVDSDFFALFVDLYTEVITYRER